MNVTYSVDKQKIMNEAELSFYLTLLCYYKCFILCIFAIIAIVKDYDYVGVGCLIGLFACIIFLQGLKKELIPILRLYQIGFIVLCAFFTGNFLLELVDVILGHSNIRYIVFPVWFLWVLPTVATIYLLHLYIEILADSLCEV